MNVNSDLQQALHPLYYERGGDFIGVTPHPPVIFPTYIQHEPYHPQGTRFNPTHVHDTTPDPPPQYQYRANYSRSEAERVMRERPDALRSTSSCYNCHRIGHGHQHCREPCGKCGLGGHTRPNCTTNIQRMPSTEGTMGISPIRWTRMSTAPWNANAVASSSNTSNDQPTSRRNITGRRGYRGRR